MLDESPVTNGSITSLTAAMQGLGLLNAVETLQNVRLPSLTVSVELALH